MTLYPRFAARQVADALADTPVVLVNGPRQGGKTTLIRELLGGRRGYVTLDDEATHAAAQADPVGFIARHDRIAIDEIQRAPDLLRAIKRSVDEDRRPGRFLLSGSADVMALPKASESLAGRIEVVTLLPLAQAEVHGGSGTFLAAALEGRIGLPPQPLGPEALVDRVLAGGYPEMLARRSLDRRAAWARGYMQAIVERDIAHVVEIEKAEALPRLLRALAHHSGQLLNLTQLGGEIGLDDKTVRKYVGVLERLFLVRRVEPWFRNRLKRLVRTPKLHFLDSGLLAVSAGITAGRIAADRALFGPLLETFVHGEILKLAAASGRRPLLFHYRDKDQAEVDLIVEAEDGGLLGIEVKASATVRATDFTGLTRLRTAAGGDFRLGIVLHDGRDVLPFGDRLLAAPISCLWS